MSNRDHHLCHCPLQAAGNHDEYALSEEDGKLLDSFNKHVNVPKENNAVNGAHIIHLIIMERIWS